MKKTYIIPSMEIEKIQATELICESLKMISGTGEADSSNPLAKEIIMVEEEEMESWGNLW